MKLIEAGEEERCIRVFDSANEFPLPFAFYNKE
jgi:hypothetical protein